MPTATVSQVPGRLDLRFTEGDTFVLTLNFGTDLSAHTGLAAQIRTTVASDDAVEFTIDDTDAADGIIVATVSAADSATLAKACVWDFEWVDPDGATLTVLAGRVVVIRQVTR